VTATIVLDTNPAHRVYVGRYPPPGDGIRLMFVGEKHNKGDNVKEKGRKRTERVN
jgi:hypothetical protein